tara:strand:+ start:403 stop:903 length:501 start_codon:yes stop_codon:yes gene_type:complete
MITSSNAWPWIKNAILLTGFSLVVNHLATRNSFPGSESYRFPIEGFLSSIALCVFIAIISKLNFKFYEKKYFSKKIKIVTIVGFITSTLGYITIIYIPIYFILSIVVGEQIKFYYLLIGLLITLLLSFITHLQKRKLPIVLLFPILFLVPTLHFYRKPKRWRIYEL